MKALTPTERALLTESTNKCDGSVPHRFATLEEHKVLAELIEQGRVVIGSCPCHPNMRTFQITADGLEALRIQKIIDEKLGAPPSQS